MSIDGAQGEEFEKHDDNKNKQLWEKSILEQRRANKGIKRRANQCGKRRAS